MKSGRDSDGLVSSWQGMHVNICKHVSKRVGAMFYRYETDMTETLKVAHCSGNDV